MRSAALASTSRIVLVSAFCCLATLPLVAEEVRVLKHDFPLLPLQGIYLDLPVAEIAIEGGAGERVSAELVVQCARFSRSCREKAEAINLRGRNHGDDLMLWIEGLPEPVRRRPNLSLRLKVPRDRALDIDLGVGEVAVFGMEGDLQIDVGVGDVDVQIAEREVGSVRLDVGVGGADLAPRQQDVASSGFLFLGKELEWRHGIGEAQVLVDVGVGEVDVRLN